MSTFYALLHIALWVYLTIGFLCWYALYNFHTLVSMEDTPDTRNIPYLLLRPFRIFWEELTWLLPGGKKRRAAVAKEVIATRMDGWAFQERLAAGETYAEIADDLLPTRMHFLFSCSIPFLWLPYLFYFTFDVSSSHRTHEHAS